MNEEDLKRLIDAAINKRIEELRPHLETMMEQRLNRDGWRGNMESQVGALKAQVEANGELCKSIDKNTGELLEHWQAAKGGFKMLNWVGIALKWLTIVVGAITAAYTLLHTMKGGS